MPQLFFEKDLKIMKKKEKKRIAPNEASLVRWIAALVMCFPLAVLLFIPAGPFFMDHVVITPNRTFASEDYFMGISFAEFFLDFGFVALFFGLVITIKLIAKTSLKDFVLGVGGKLNKKECLTILGLYATGMLLNYLPNLDQIRPRGVNPGHFLFLVLYALVVVWEQTTWEELVFRGLMIRWACKNKVGFSKKTYLLVVVTAVAFAMGHSKNPELASLSGIQLVLAIASYGVTGTMFLLTDLYFGSLMPGILIHWLNNFVLTTLIAAEDSAIMAPTLFIADATGRSGVGMLIGNLLPWLPIMVYIFLDYRKKKKAAQTC
jgi:membrane protease YdiL (CAAX protease family)